VELRNYDVSWDFKQFYNQNPYGEKYRMSPLVASAFIQDKMEYRDFVVNLGLRMDYRDADRFFDFETGLRGVGIKLEDMYEASGFDARLRDELPLQLYGTNNWIQMNQNLFSYMKIEKILMFLMLTLVILVAAFNLVGMLTMVIMEKRTEIGILRSMGASSRGIMSVFMLEGTAIGVGGTVGGLIFGYLACTVLDRIQLDLPGDVYFIKTLPVLVQWPDLVLVSASSVLICFLATVYPSWEASRMVPVDAIRDV
jgi:lipoprotein-releasing system permease protein